MRLICRGVLFVVALGVAGCGGDRPRLAAVKGMVTLDDKPLLTGEIKFALVGDGSVPTLLPITQGVYEGQAPVGNNRVEIYAYRLLTSGPKGAPGAEEASREVIIPAAYNTESTLAAEVRADGRNEFNYEVKSRR